MPLQYIVQQGNTKLVFDIQVHRSPFSANYKRYTIIHREVAIRHQLSYPSEADCLKAYSDFCGSKEVTK